MTNSQITKRVEEFLCSLIRFPSTPGEELPAMEFLYDQFGKFNVDVQKIPLSNSLKTDSEYSSPIVDIDYEGRFNLRIIRRGRGTGKAIIFNAHVDVVPASEEMQKAFDGVISKDGIVFGRGACDNKGGIAAIYTLLDMLDENNITLDGDLIVHLVVEEENGGNGSLAMIRNGEAADACIVLEPTELNVITSIRGAVWFKIEFFGKAGHSGQAEQTKSALLLAHEAITLLQNYHNKLLNRSQNIALFDRYENPMPITFGRLEAGNWPASAPNNAVLEGVLGFLPNKKREHICTEMKQALLKSKLLNNENFKLSFTYRHDSSVISPKHPFAQELLSAANKVGIRSRIDAMPASCDAWLYNNMLDIATVVFGPGSLKVAHSNEEHISIDGVIKAGQIFFEFINKFIV